ncbi:MAG: PEP-CTERM sorting domain-containing protein [Pseudomonadota bacterium]
MFEGTFALAFFGVFLPTNTFNDRALSNASLDNIALGFRQPDVLTRDGVVPAVILEIDFNDGDDFVTFGRITPVPVPASLPLLAGGTGLLAIAARRRRKSARRG